jgi:hypothetical protein
MQRKIEWQRATLLHKHLENAAEQLTLRRDFIAVLDGQSRKEEDESRSQEAFKGNPRVSCEMSPNLHPLYLLICRYCMLLRG